MSLSRRSLTFEFSLGQGAFGATGADTVTLTGLRAGVNIQDVGALTPQLSARIYGMPLDVMNRLSILANGMIIATSANTVRVMADGAYIFVGTIVEAWIDPNDAPNVSFIVTAKTGLLDKLKPVPPVSYKEGADAGQIASDIANSMGVPFRNNGVTGTVLVNHYLPGTAMDQFEALSRDAGFDWAYDGAGITIWPHNGTRDSDTIITVDSTTGLVGYPQHSESGITLQMLLNPNVRYGSRLLVRSSIGAQDKDTIGTDAKQGRWDVFGVTYDLESETHGGKWFQTVECSVAGTVLAGGK